MAEGRSTDTGNHIHADPGPEKAKLEGASNDDYRYLEHLQRQLIPDGWEGFFRGDNRGPTKDVVEVLIAMVAPTLAETDERVLDFVREMWTAPVEFTTGFENRITEARYRPVLDKVISAANEIKLPRVRPIDLVTSTDISCTPMARPTEGRHLLFAGEGTARFCNFWTKAISRVFFTVKSLSPGLSPDEWDHALLSAKPSGIGLAAMLALKYAFEGTMLQFRWVPNIPEETEWRAALLDTMFTFSVAHEYAHFIAYETVPGAQGMLSEVESKQLELWCDKVAIQISTHIGRQKGLVHLHAGIGALSFFRALQICHAVRRLYLVAGRLPAGQDANPHMDTHPALDERVKATVAELLKLAAPDEQDLVQCHVDGCLSMLDIMEELTIRVVEKVIALRTGQAKQE